MKHLTLFTFLWIWSSIGYTQPGTDTITQMNHCLYMPNVLTPDCDDFNCDQLKVISQCKIYDYELTIYNKSADAVHQSYDIEEVWYPSAQDLPHGTLLWQITGYIMQGGVNTPIKWQGLIAYLR